MLGSKTQRYVLSFTEPWLFDIPLSAGVELYKWKYEFDEYDKDSIGGKLRFGYPLYDYVRGNLTYTWISPTSATWMRMPPQLDPATTRADTLKSSISADAALRFARQPLQRQGGLGSQHRVRIRRPRRGCRLQQGHRRYRLVFPLVWKLVGVRPRPGRVRERAAGLGPAGLREVLSRRHQHRARLRPRRPGAQAGRRSRSAGKSSSRATSRSSSRWWRKPAFSGSSSSTPARSTAEDETWDFSKLTGKRRAGDPLALARSARSAWPTAVILDPQKADYRAAGASSFRWPPRFNAETLAPLDRCGRGGI
ncbi:MAG: BamA/TamA family outer membrane protein [Desulfobacterales bacterium]|nr:BamA/TamA family outer membrane protein [Desulfobacterales bacterium]